MIFLYDLYGLELMPDIIKYSQVLKYSNVVLLRCVCSLGVFAAAQNKLESLPSLTSIFACPLEIFRSIYLVHKSTSMYCKAMYRSRKPKMDKLAVSR